MQYFLYFIWLIIPFSFYLMALWSRLEQETQKKKGKANIHEAGDLLKTANHLAICSLLTFLIDRYTTGTIIAPNLPSFVPIPMMQLLLLPAVMYVVALVKGKAEPIRITKAPSPTERRRKK